MPSDFTKLVAFSQRMPPVQNIAILGLRPWAERLAEVPKPFWKLAESLCFRVDRAIEGANRKLVIVARINEDRVRGR